MELCRAAWESRATSLVPAITNGGQLLGGGGISGKGGRWGEGGAKGRGVGTHSGGWRTVTGGAERGVREEQKALDRQTSAHLPGAHGDRLHLREPRALRVTRQPICRLLFWFQVRVEMKWVRFLRTHLSKEDHP